MKKIALLATGGTIASAMTGQGLAPALTSMELLRHICPMGEDVQILPVDVMMMDSTNIQPEEWRQIARAVDCAIQEADGVVITHGTDTMAYSAAALSFMLSGRHKPVILTGSQLPIDHPLSDAPANLSGAISVALTGVEGTYVYFDRKLINGARAVKLRTTSFDAFGSVNWPLSGVYDSDGLHVDHPQPAGGPYRLRDELDPNVFLLKLMPGTSPEVLDWVASAGYHGVVIEAFGLGGLHYIRRNLVDRLHALTESGVIALVTTQCMYEKASFAVYEVGRHMRVRGVYNGRDMTTEAAVAKLMWVLGDRDARGDLLQSCICGEICDGE